MLKNYERQQANITSDIEALAIARGRSGGEDKSISYQLLSIQLQSKCEENELVSDIRVKIWGILGVH